MYHKTEETNFSWTSYGQNGVLLIGRGVAYRQNGGNGLVLECYGRNGGPVHREGCGVPQNGTPRDAVHFHRRPPPTSTGYRRPPPASTGSYSSSLHRVLLHWLLFNHPSTVYCSSSPPPHHGVLFIQRQRHRSLFIQTPPQHSLFVPEAASIGFS